MCVHLSLWVCIGPLESISICNDLNSIMLNVADRIKVVEADVKSIKNIGHKRQQCPLSLQKIIFKKLLCPHSTVGGPVGKKTATASAIDRQKVNPTRPL